MRAIITGGPGSGCSSTASQVAAILGVAHFDSDSYFHKPTDPPYQEPYSPEERRELVTRDLQTRDSWILSGSVATWELMDLELTHAVVLNVGATIRLKRLARRERERFGARIETRGDMREEHESFMGWAAAYETRENRGRNFQTDLEFARVHSPMQLVIGNEIPFEETCEIVCHFLTSTMRNDPSLPALGPPSIFRLS